MARLDETIRAFLAVELDDAIQRDIDALVQRVKPNLPGVAWTRSENRHLTLRFFGNVGPSLVDEFASRLQPIASGETPVSATVSTLGAFPNTRRPSVIWVGIEFDTDRLHALQATAEHLARELGIPPETRPFTPHVTIGRVRRGAPKFDARPALDAERDFSAGAMTIKAVSLFSSGLTPQGARYTRLHRLTFDGIRRESGL